MDADVAASGEHGFNEQEMIVIQRIITVLLGAYSKLKLYPAEGPVAKQAVSQVMAAFAPFFETRPALTLTRIDSSLLINGVRMDTSGFETMASGMIRFLSGDGIKQPHVFAFSDGV